MTVKFETKTTHYIDYGEFESLVNETFSPEEDYYYLAAEETSNYSAQTLEAFKTPKYDFKICGFEGYKQKFVEKRLNDIPSWAILRALVLLDKLPEGYWVIKVSW